MYTFAVAFVFLDMHEKDIRLNILFSLGEIPPVAGPQGPDVEAHNSMTKGDTGSTCWSGSRIWTLVKD